jgi:hypothetical protein
MHPGQVLGPLSVTCSVLGLISTGHVDVGFGSAGVQLARNMALSTVWVMYMLTRVSCMCVVCCRDQPYEARLITLARGDACRAVPWLAPVKGRRALCAGL